MALVGAVKHLVWRDCAADGSSLYKSRVLTWLILKTTLNRLGKGEVAIERTAFGASWKWGILQGTVISLYQDANDSESSMPLIYSKAALTVEISSYAVLCFCIKNKGCCGE